MSNTLKQVDDKIKALPQGEGELDLDGIKIQKITPELKDKLQKIKDLDMLNMNDCGLESLANFPKLSGLVRLELLQNKFPASELKTLVDNLPKLQILVIGQNDIKEFDEIAPLVGLKKLMQLDLANTPLSQKEDYRERVFKLFPSLESLDDLDRNGNPVEFDDELGHDDDDDEDEEDVAEEEEEYQDEEEDDEEEDEDEDDEEEEPVKKNSRKKVKKF